MGIEIAFPGVENLLQIERDQAAAGPEFWAGPSTRKFAREFGVDIGQVHGSGLYKVWINRTPSSQSHSESFSCQSSA